MKLWTIQSEEACEALLVNRVKQLSRDQELKQKVDAFFL